MINMQAYLYNLATDRQKGFIAFFIKILLFLLSVIYALFIRFLIFINWIFARKLHIRVVSVGNITLGGTGKTTLVEYICRFLKGRGKRVVILTRGYKRKMPGFKASDTGYEGMGDEPYMLSKNLGDIPVIVDADRLKSAKKAMNDFAADTVVLDDGFQQWKIKKDLEIVSIDATNPFGNRQMIPRGILREPLSSLRRADIFVLTKANLSKDVEAIRNYLASLNARALIVEAIHKPLGIYPLNNPSESLDICSLEGKTVALFSGIGDPESFEKLIQILGAKIGVSFKFRDHHDYTRKDLETIIQASRDKKIETIITTEKDASRLTWFTASDQVKILILPINLVITKEEERFRDRLLKLYTL